MCFPALEHFKGLEIIKDEIEKAHAALTAGQVDAYKARAHSIYISLQLLLKSEVS